MSRLELRQIVKRFGSVHALRGADFSLMPGRVHALLGENGAGKSTLMHVAYGMVEADAGTVLVDGAPVTIRSPKAARAHGIGMVHQHFTSVPALTVGENIRLAGGRLDARAEGGPLGRLWQGLDPETLVESLSVARKQRLEIVKALASGARILLLDEPTAVLAPAEVEELLVAVRGFAATGGAVVLITHKLDEVLAAADEVTVLRHGVVTLHGPAAEQSEQSLAAAMIGGTAPAGGARGSWPTAAPGRTAARLTEASVAPLEGRGPGLREATVELRAGELVGVASVEGNGHRELMLSLAMVLPLTAGDREISEPVVLVPEDRTTEALIPGFTLTENMMLGLGDRRWRAGRWLDWKAARARTAALLPAFDVRAPGPDALAGMLSGGNQQKLVLARALEAHPKVLVVENPTRGLDIRATAAVHTRLREAAASGVAVIVYSSDLDEVLDLAQRVLVVVRGQVRPMRLGATRDEVGAVMLGVVPGESAE